MSIVSEIPRLILEQGQAAAQGQITSARALADAQRQIGQIWGGTLANIGQTIAELPLRIQQAKAAQQEQQIRAMQLQQAQQQVNDMKALDAAFMQPGGRDKIIQSLPGHLRPKVEQQFIEHDKAFAELQEAQEKVGTLQADAFGRAAAIVRSHGYDPIAAQGVVSDLKQKYATDPAMLGQIKQVEAAIQANPTPDFIRSVVDPLIDASPTQRKLDTEAQTAAARATSATTGAKKLEAELPGIAARNTIEQQTAAGQVPIQPAQQAEMAQRAPLIAAQTREATARVPLIGAETTKARAEGAKAGLEAQQLQQVAGTINAAAAAPEAKPGERNEDFLKSLPPAMSAQVKALAEGRMQFPSGFALRSPYWQGMLQAVAKYDPSFDAVNYNARAKTRADFTSGKAAQQVNAINTVIGHLSNLSTAADALNNSNFPLLNRVTNTLATAVGKPNVTNFNTIKKAVSDEVTRVWRQAGGSVEDIKQAQQNLDAAGSPEQLNGAIATYADLLESKLSSLNEQYRQGMGTDKIDMVTPTARATLNALKRKVGEPVSETGLPPGVTVKKIK